MSQIPPSGQIVIAGGSGFLGISLATHLSDLGAKVVILSRTPPKLRGPWRHVSWDGRTLGEWSRELDGASGLVNLAGRSVDCIKTPDHCDEILRSRIEATRFLGLALYGRYVVSQRLAEEQFEFQFPELRAALSDLLRGQ